MSYCLIEEGSITDGPRDLPKAWRNISGLNLLSDARLKELGWLPYINTEPSFDADTQYLTSEKVIGEDAVTETYTVNDYTEAEMTTRIADAKVARNVAIRAEAQTVITADYPLWFQSNVALGVYDSTVGDPMKAAIAAIIVASNTAEDAVEACTTLAEIRNTTPTWPSEEVA